MKLSIIIPCYNEESTIEEIIKEIGLVDLIDTKKEIIIIDDGSTDKTQEILQQLKSKFEFQLLRHPKNLGKGAAIKTALDRVSGDYVIIQDADLEYDPQDYKKLLWCARDKGARVVYGSRYSGMENKYIHPIFYTGGRVLTLLTNLLYRSKITDEATCYKLFKKDVICGIDLKCKGFDFCPEVTAKVLKKGIKIYEVMISYYPRHIKDGKKIKLTDGLESIWILIKYRFIN
jgi:dolichol-phosphate mannosyltransferase